jgi:hypothetical protein
MKTCTPYSFGQLFKFYKKRKNNASRALLNHTGIREDSKNLLAASSESGLSFYERSHNNNSVVGIDCKLLGYPKVDSSKIDKLFQELKPEGYFDVSLSHSFIKSLLNSNFVELQINKIIRPVNKPTNIYITSSNYTSTNHYINGVKRINLQCDYSYSAANRSANYGQFDIDNFSWNFMDFYVPSYNFSNETAPDLAILPSGSIVWYYHKSENKWITCCVVNTRSKNGFKIKTEFIEVEIEEGKIKYSDVVYTIRTTTEPALTKIIQKLIQTDQIRIVISSLKNILPSSARYNTTQINPTMLKLLKTKFNCDFLNQLKLSIFDSSEHKNLNNFGQFIKELFDKKGKPLEARYHDKVTLSNVAIEAIKAAEDDAPIFWGIKETLKWETNEDEIKKIQKILGYSFCNNSERFLDLDTKSALNRCASNLKHVLGLGYYGEQIPSVEVNVEVDIDRKVLLERADVETYNVSISTPKYIHDMGKEAVSKFIKTKLNWLKDSAMISGSYTNLCSDSSVKFSNVKVVEGLPKVNKKPMDIYECKEIKIKEAKTQ